MRMKGEFYKSMVKPTMVYDLECWAVDRKIELSTKVVKMKMLRGMSGVTSGDKIRNLKGKR